MLIILSSILWHVDHPLFHSLTCWSFFLSSSPLDMVIIFSSILSHVDPLPHICANFYLHFLIGIFSWFLSSLTSAFHLIWCFFSHPPLTTSCDMIFTCGVLIWFFTHVISFSDMLILIAIILTSAPPSNTVVILWHVELMSYSNHSHILSPIRYDPPF